MVARPVLFRPTLEMRAALFMVVIAYSILAFVESQYAFVVLNSDPSRWPLRFVWLTSGSMSTISILLWLFKNRVEVTNTEWHRVERDLTPQQFFRLAKEYSCEYSHLTKRLDWILITLSVALFAVIAVAPFVSITLLPSSIAMMPIVVGAATAVFAIVAMRAIYQAIPTKATHLFPPVHASVIRSALRLLRRCPGISVTTVRVVLLESQGFYRIESFRATGHIAGLEGVGLVIVDADTHGRPLRAHSLLQLDESKYTSVVDLGPDPESVITSLVLDTVRKYLDAHDDGDLQEFFENSGLGLD
ncbi:MAG: hypothetical protein QXS20_02645 [Candidatus Thorarchaeota archaeon]